MPAIKDRHKKMV